MDSMTSWIRSAVAAYGPPIFEGVGTLVFGWILAKLLCAGLRRILKRSGVDETLGEFCANLAYVTMLALIVITALDRFGFPAVSFAAVVGAAGLAIGLALKGTLSNLAAGVMLIAFRPFSVGDRIEAGGASGVVTHIGVFATTLKGADDKRIIVPNAAITGGNITTLPTG